MQVTTTSFAAGAAIPSAFTGDGRDDSPAIAWSGAPASTRAYALICDDPDAPAGLWTHWVVYDLPATVHALEAAQPRTPELPGGGRQGTNTWGRVGWNGPLPPSGKPHRYFFRVYALAAPLGLPEGASPAQVKLAMRDKVLAEGDLMGTYQR
jgi:Raf kinase inhibitor-like YbhB/YbcL family protein